MFIRRYDELRRYISQSSQYRVLGVIVIAVFFTVVGCNQQPVPEIETIDTPPTSVPAVLATSIPAVVEDAYPAPATEPTMATGSYPAPANTLQVAESYPAPGEIKDGILFAINTPLRAGGTEVTGVGPSGVTVFLVNVTLMGEPLGSTTIGNDGTFRIVVPPLSANIQVGLAADLEAAGIDLDSIIPGEGARAVPLVGYYFDTALVTE